MFHIFEDRKSAVYTSNARDFPTPYYYVLLSSARSAGVIQRSHGIERDQNFWRTRDYGPCDHDTPVTEKIRCDFDNPVALI